MDQRPTRSLKYSDFLPVAFPGIIPDVFDLVPSYSVDEVEGVNVLFENWKVRERARPDLLLVFLRYRSTLLSTIAHHHHQNELKDATKTEQRLKFAIRETESAVVRAILTDAREKCLKYIKDLEGFGAFDDQYMGRPVKLETRVIDCYEPVAVFVWFFDLIPGNRKDESKEAVYKFIYEFIALSGFDWPDSHSYRNIKQRLKGSLHQQDTTKYL